jgi:hypothetical protein
MTADIGPIVKALLTALLTGFQIGIRRGANSFQLRSGFIRQNLTFEE